MAHHGAADEVGREDAPDLAPLFGPESRAEVPLTGRIDSLGDAVAVPGSAVVYKHISISDGPHRLQGDGPFGILVFAFDDFVSYAFTGGLNLRKR